jgi:hypothetical protein
MRKTLDEDPQILIFLCNFTPVPRHNYRVGVPLSGYYREIFNSDAGVYGGKNMVNADGSYAEPIPWQAHSYSVCLTLPPLSTIILKPEGEEMPHRQPEKWQEWPLQPEQNKFWTPGEEQGGAQQQEAQKRRSAEAQKMRKKQEEEQMSPQKRESRLRRVSHGYNYPYE